MRFIIKRRVCGFRCLYMCVGVAVCTAIRVWGVSRLYMCVCELHCQYNKTDRVLFLNVYAFMCVEKTFAKFRTQLFAACTRAKRVCVSVFTCTLHARVCVFTCTLHARVCVSTCTVHYTYFPNCFVMIHTFVCVCEFGVLHTRYARVCVHSFYTLATLVYVCIVFYTLATLVYVCVSTARQFVD